MKTLKLETVENILKNHIDPKKDVNKHLLFDGRHVIAYHIDEDNHLHYVVRNKDGTPSVIDAQGAGVANFWVQPKPQRKVTVTFSPDGKVKTIKHEPDPIADHDLSVSETELGQS